MVTMFFNIIVKWRTVSYCASVVLHVCDNLDGGKVKKFENINNSKAVFEASLINVAVPFGESCLDYTHCENQKKN